MKSSVQPITTQEIYPIMHCVAIVIAVSIDLECFNYATVIA